MRTLLREQLTAALKARDRVAVAALRSALAAIDNAEAVAGTSSPMTAPTSEHVAGATSGVGSSDVDRRVLSDSDVRAIVRAEVSERLQAAEDYVRLGRADEADTLRREAFVLNAYLVAND